MAERPARVLVVEDDTVIREAMLDALELDAYDARGVHDGAEALRLMDQWSPDVILLDLMMPVLDAWGFRQEQRKQRKQLDVPVIIVSAGRDLLARTADLNPVAIIAKPFDLDVFLETVRRFSASRRPAGTDS